VAIKVGLAKATKNNYNLIMKHAFSLVELSIVLVILGLLVGGILSGQSLIRAAELRAISSEYNRYSTAVYSFRDKYFAMPGDMTNATAFWGAADAGNGLGSDCTDVASTTITTCNGNGDGRVENNSPESFRFWQHLANAGLIEGTYTGRTSAALGTWIFTPGVNAPRSRISNATWSFRYMGPLSASASTWARDYGQGLGFGGGGDYYTLPAALTPPELWNVDTKVDDGKPGLGRLVAYPANNCSDTSDGNVTSANYLLSSTTVACSLLSRTD
jgi:prepilin-type N-terminal cleavage/methylation domain-containing protein